jgi:hypothetical protein
MYCEYIFILKIKPMRTYLVVLCLLVSTLALSQRYRDSIHINYVPYGVYDGKVFLYNGDTIQRKSDFVRYLLDSLNPDKHNVIVCGDNVMFYAPICGNRYYMDGKVYSNHILVRNKVGEKINQWIREKKLVW